MHREAIRIGDVFADGTGKKWWVWSRTPAGVVLRSDFVLGPKADTKPVDEGSLRERYTFAEDNPAGRVVFPALVPEVAA